MGEHLSPSGGRDLENFLRGESKEPKSHLLQGGEPKKLTKFRGGIQRNCHFFQILGGEFFGWGKNFSEGGEYFAKEYPSRWGGISTTNFSGGGYPRQLPPLRPCMLGVAKKNWTFMEIAANFWKAKFFNPNDETHFDFLIGWIPREHTECPRSLCSVVEQASWALRVRPGDSSDQKVQMGFIIRVKKLSFSEICT